MFCINTDDLAKVLQKHKLNMLLDEGNLHEILKTFGSEWLIVGGEWQEVNKPVIAIDEIESWGFVNSRSLQVRNKV